MIEPTDHELLADYARTGNEAAFAQLVARHINLVHSAARRFTGNDPQAEEITQAVFLILARKAGSLGKNSILTGWLYQTARLTAANLLKAETRRQMREQEAYMQSQENESDAAVWRQIAPLLDDAMGRLNATDRSVLLLRFFERQTNAEVAAALGTAEGAVQKRALRALEKLRTAFAKQGVTHTAQAIAGTVLVNSVQAAPTALVTKVSVIAAKGAATTTSIAALVKGTLNAMTWSKIKSTIGISAGILTATCAVTIIAISQADKWTPQEIVQQSQATYAALSSYSDAGTATASGHGITTTTTFKMRLQRPNFYRIDWSKTGAPGTNQGSVWSVGNGDYLQSKAIWEKIAKPEKVDDMSIAFSGAAAVSDSASTGIPAEFFKTVAIRRWGSDLDVAASVGSQLKKEGDEKVGNDVCHVVSTVLKLSTVPEFGKSSATITTMIWIGKRDHLIHKTKEDWSTGSIFTQIHENIVVNQNFSPTDFVVE